MTKLFLNITQHKLFMVLIGTFFLLSGWQFTLFFKEEQALKNLLHELKLTPAIPPEQALEKILAATEKQMLVFEMDKDELLEWERNRPLLRHSAISTWESQIGLCGESTRLNINLLRHLGIPARRVSLFKPNAESFHTALEFKTEKGWIYGEAFGQSAVDMDYAPRHPQPIAKHLKTPGNPYAALVSDYSYLNFSGRFGFKSMIIKPLPLFLSNLLELPSLMMAFFYSVLGGFLLLAKILLSRLQKKPLPIAPPNKLA